MSLPSTDLRWSNSTNRHICNVSVAPFWRISVSCSVSATPQGYAVFVQIKAWINIEDVSARCGWHTRAYAVCIQRIYSKMALHWHWGDELLNKVVIFVFFAYKEYSCSFVKLRLNPWCHMDCFTDLLATFLDVDRVYYIAVYGGSESCQKASKIS